jgi:hypothetical protein
MNNKQENQEKQEKQNDKEHRQSESSHQAMNRLEAIIHAFVVQLLDEEGRVRVAVRVI